MINKTLTIMKKKIFLFTTFISLVLIGLAQVPEAFNYQAVVRNSSGDVVSNQNVSFRISILQGSESGTVMYAETHTVSTNAFGLVNLKIGDGALVSGVFSPGGWGATSHFLKVEVDPDGGSSYTHLGTSELLSVPYAFHAQTVEADMVDDADADPTNELQTISLVGSDLTLSDGGGTVTLPSPTGGDDWGTQTVESDATLSGNGTSGDPLGVIGDLTDDQTLSIVGNDLTISEGNTVPLPGDDWGAQVVQSDATLSGVGTSGDPLGVIGDLSDDQTLSLVGDNLSISNGNSVNIGGADNQTLSVAGNDLSISNGNSVSLPSVWSLNGSNAYYNGGSVGIGTTTPLRLLHLLGGTSSHIAFHNTYTGTTTTDGLLVGIESSNNNAYIWNYEDGPIRLGIGNDNMFTILADGNVGVGTYTPTRLFDVHGGTTNSWMGFHTNTTGNSASDGLLVGVNSTTLNAYVWNYENTGLYFGTNGFFRMMIQADGDVGIGTETPDQRLSVNGNASKSSGGTTWAIFSDRRLKDLHGNYNKGLSEIVALQPVVFNYKVDNPLDLPSDNEEVGLIAQEVRGIFPEAISESRSGYLDFNMHYINVAFINAIKELKAANDDLQEQVNELESRLAEIEKILQQ
jgi:hypothetical protein